jgi:hypothetical protein
MPGRYASAWDCRVRGHGHLYAPVLSQRVRTANPGYVEQEYSEEMGKGQPLSIRLLRSHPLLHLPRVTAHSRRHPPEALAHPR